MEEALKYINDSFNHRVADRAILSQLTEVLHIPFYSTIQSVNDVKTVYDSVSRLPLYGKVAAMLNADRRDLADYYLGQTVSKGDILRCIIVLINGNHQDYAEQLRKSKGIDVELMMNDRTSDDYKFLINSQRTIDYLASFGWMPREPEIRAIRTWWR